MMAMLSFKGYSQSKTPQEKIRILKNGYIIQLTSDNASVKKGSLVIEGDKIKEILYEEVSEIADADIIDITGKYVLPGLVDAHVHLATVPKEERNENNQYMEQQLDKMLFAGITTVRDMAGNAIILGDYKRAVSLGQVKGPDIYHAAMFAGPGYFEMTRRFPSGKRSPKDTPWEQTITDTTTISLAIARAKGAGVSGIKIYSDLSKELVQKITEEAKLQGLQAWAHAAIFPASPMDIAQSKVHSMSHAFDIVYGLDKKGPITREDKVTPIDTKKLDLLLQVMKENNIILDATNYIAENNKLYIGTVITKRAKEFGVKVAVGTDWPYLMEDEIPFYKELRLLVEKSGFTMAEALWSATQIGTESIGLTDRGSIKEGKRADFLITNENPLDGTISIKGCCTWL